MPPQPTAREWTTIRNVVGATDIADRIGVAPRLVRKWAMNRTEITGERSDPMPDPIRYLSGRFPEWWWPAVEAWLIRTGRVKKVTPR